MISEELLTELDIEEGSFAFFEQFAALMETSADLDYDTFAELIVMADPEAFPNMISSFFEDIIRGVPDDNTSLYSTLESRRTVLETLAGNISERSIGVLIEELFSFREWFMEPESVICTPENADGFYQRVSPCQAMMLYREEKLSGPKYDYDFSEAFLEEIDEYALSFMEDQDGYSLLTNYGDEDEEDEYLPDELPADFDISSYVPGETDLSEWTSLDPYRDGLIDRNNPVIDGEQSEENE